MAIDPESFDEPVKDYDFSSLTTASSLIDQMATAGGFTATKLAYARDILIGMKKEIADVLTQVDETYKKLLRTDGSLLVKLNKALHGLKRLQ